MKRHPLRENYDRIFGERFNIREQNASLTAQQINALEKLAETIMTEIEDNIAPMGGRVDDIDILTEVESACIDEVIENLDHMRGRDR